MNKIIVMKNGAEFPIIGEDGKYFYCGNTQFRKSNPMIAEIRELVEEVGEEPVEPEEKPKKKKSAKKKADEKAEEQKGE